MLWSPKIQTKLASVQVSPYSTHGLTMSYLMFYRCIMNTGSNQIGIVNFLSQEVLGSTHERKSAEYANGQTKTWAEKHQKG